MHYLALDIGKRRTGVAFGDSDADAIIALHTIHHHTSEELVQSVSDLVRDRNIGHLVIGDPLLPDGTKGEQAQFTDDVVAMMEKVIDVPITRIDERYTSRSDLPCTDPDAVAACAILDIAFTLRKKSI